GKAAEIPAGDDTVTALAALKDGGLPCASGAPAWGVVNPAAHAAFTRNRQQADFRDGYVGGFAASPDGSVVDFGFVQGGKQRARFDLLSGTLEMNPAPRPELVRPRTTDGAIKVTDWRNNSRPRLNGAALPLDANEKSESAAVQGDWVLLGTDYCRGGYKGRQLAWRTELPAPAWMVNLSADGRLAIVGVGDGTIRWFRLSDGVELLSLFAEPEGARWVSWTPEGFF